MHTTNSSQRLISSQNLLLQIHMATQTIVSLVFLILLVTAAAMAVAGSGHRGPCQQHVFYFHDILYNGRNYNNATAAIVGSPQWGNKSTLTVPYNFGDVVVFDDPITLSNELHAAPAGPAQGMYMYDQRSTYSAWVGFSFLFNSTEHVGALNFAGADPMMNKTRDISVIGGTGDFFMARGIATLTMDALLQASC